MSGPMPPAGLMAALAKEGKQDPDAPLTPQQQADKAFAEKEAKRRAMIERGKLNKLHAERKKKRKQKQKMQRRNRK